MTDLAEFLLARVAETIADARYVQAQAVTDGDDPGDPRRAELCLARYVLVECEAKRRIVAMHHDDREHACPNEDGATDHYGHLHGWAEEDQYPQICPTLRLLALPYADHRDYREEWRP